MWLSLAGVIGVSVGDDVDVENDAEVVVGVTDG
jgi:hypothetical protein